MDIFLKTLSQIQLNSDLQDYFLPLPLDCSLLEVEDHICFIDKFNTRLSHSLRQM